MGAGASVDHAVDIDEAKKLAGEKFDEAKWNGSEKDGEGKVSDATWNAWVKETEAASNAPADAAPAPAAAEAAPAPAEAPTEAAPAPAPAAPTAAPADAAQAAEASKKTTYTHMLAEAVADLKSCEVFKGLWDALDKNADGKITAKEWHEDCQKHADVLSTFFGGASVPEIGKAFHRIDEDDSECLSWDEFTENCASYLIAEKLAEEIASAEGCAELRALFDKIDSDKCGKVSQKEWFAAVRDNKELIAKRFGGGSVPQIAKVFHRLNADKDDEITWDEFCKGAAAFSASEAA